MEGSRKFQAFRITSVIRKGRGSEGILKMLREANKALDPLSFIKDYLKSCKGLVGRFSIVLQPSHYKAAKLTFPWDIGGLAQDGAISKEMAIGSMSQTVGVLTPAMLNDRGLRSDSRRFHLLLYLRRCSIDICCLQETRFDSNFHKDILSKGLLSIF